MQQILLRSRKGPFDVVSAEETLQRNMIAANAGNLIFSVATHGILHTAGTTVTSDRFVIDSNDADRINERYDVYVIPLANAFRVTYESNLIRLTQLIRRLRIPVVILGVGVQSDLRSDMTRLRPIQASVKAFASAVLDRSPSIGVRGEVTLDYLSGLGFRDAEVIGCPSLFMHGPDLEIRKRLPALDRDARLAINVSPYVEAMAPIVSRHVERYQNLTYIPQDLDALELLLWGPGRAHAAIAPTDPRPIHLVHPLFRDDKVRFFVDPAPWFQFLSGVDFSFGTRIHGNIAALIAGTPAVVLAHDSRTLELARYFEIPYRLMPDMGPETDASDLYAEADYGPFNRGHAARFATFVAFLERHGLDHVFRSPAPEPDFTTRLATTPFPPAVTMASRVQLHGLVGRVKRLRQHARRLARIPWIRRLRIAMARGFGQRDDRPGV